MIGRFRWLRFRRRPERCIFEFYDGRATRYADPMEAWRAIEQAAGPEWPELLRLLTADPPPGTTVGVWADRRREDQEKAAAKLGEAACIAFGVVPLDQATGRGMTRAERVGIVASFLAYMGSLAEQARPFRGAGDGVRAAAGPDVPGDGRPVDAAEGSPATAGA